MKIKFLIVLLLFHIFQCQNNPIKFKEINNNLDGNWSKMVLDSVTLRCEKTYGKNDSGFTFCSVVVTSQDYDSNWGFCKIYNDTTIRWVSTGRKYRNIDTNIGPRVALGMGNMTVKFINHDTAIFSRSLFIRKR